MANKFTDSAKTSLCGSPVMQGRMKIATDEIIRTHPDGVTITEFDLIVKADGSSYPVFAFAENPNAYFNGGALAAKVAQGWAKSYDGDIAAASAELKACGGARFKLYTKKTRSGKTITAFDPVE